MEERVCLFSLRHDLVSPERCSSKGVFPKTFQSKTILLILLSNEAQSATCLFLKHAFFQHVTKTNPLSEIWKCLRLVSVVLLR